MATPDKVEAVKKVTEIETLSKDNDPNKGHFDSLMSSVSGAQAVKPSSFERIDTKVYGANEVQSVEPKPVFAEENVSAQKNGSATDQERKHKQQQQGPEEIEGVSGTRSKGPASTSTSLLDEVSKLNKQVTGISNLSPEGIKAQAKDVISQIENVKTRLTNAKGEIKPSYQTLLKNRLTHIDDSLKIALNKVGLEYTPPVVDNKAGSSNAVKTFLSFLTNSQNQLQNLDNVIEKFNADGQLTAANMLTIQMKMGYVQQQVELFTSLLNKALESTKTIMNVQV